MKAALVPRIARRPGAFLAAALFLIPPPAVADVAIGPFETEDALTAGTVVLDESGIGYEVRDDAERESLGFIVVSEVMPPAEGGDLSGEMAERGISDTVYVGVGVYAGRVSAGVFGRRDSAERRVRQLARAGFEFTIMERSRVVAYEGWIDADAMMLPGSVIADIEAAAGRPLEIVADQPSEPVGETIVDEPDDIAVAVVEETPATSAPTATPETPPESSIAQPGEKPASSPAQKPSTETEPSAESRVAGPEFSARTTQPKDRGGVPFVVVFALAVAVSALGAWLYVWLSRRGRTSTSSLIQYEEQHEPSLSEAVGRPEPMTEEKRIDSISEFAEVVLGASGDEQGTWLANVSAQDTEVISLIDDVIDLARVESGEGDGENVSFDLRSLLENLVDNLSRRADKRTVKFQPGSCLPVIDGNSDRLRRIVRNLLNAAIELDDAAAVEMCADCSDDDIPVLTIDISNEFATLSSAEREELFDTSETSGLRLSISRRLAQKLDGNIVVVDGEPDGTTLRLSVPVEVVEDRLHLSDGRTVGELVESEASARALGESSRQVVNEAEARIEKLTHELERARAQARESLKQDDDSIAEAQARVGELTEELGRARVSLDEEARARHESEQTHGRQITELEEELKRARENLTAELDARKRAEREAETRVGELTEELNGLRREIEAREQALESAQARAKEEIASLQSALASSEDELSSMDARKEGEVARLRERNAALEQAIKEAEARLAEDEQGTEQAVAEARQEMEALSMRLVDAEAKAKEESEVRMRVEESGRAEVSMLKNRLETVEAELEKARAAQEESDSITELKTQLASAEARLSEEVDKRRRAERETTSYIDELLNDVNKARADAKKEAQARANAELEKQERIEELSRELEDTRKRLIAEATARRRAEERAKAAAEMEPGQEEAAPASSELSDRPIRSVMPMNNPILHSMAERFVARLHQQLNSMEDAYEDEDLQEVVQIANWIKGESYTLGFHDFSEPVAELEAHVKDREYSRIPAKLVELKHMASRIEIEEPPVEAQDGEANAARPSSTRVRYHVPKNDAKRADMLENFIAQLGTQLLEMESAAMRGRMSDVSYLVRWILKYAGAFDLTEITEAAEKIQRSIDAGGDDLMDELGELSALYSTIEIVK